MKAQDLKNSILQLAMEGKLVPQNPDDVPAKELLAQIKKEVEQLIKDKKIKRKIKESVIFRDNGHFYEKVGKKGEPVCIDDEIPFDIPDNWEFSRLGNIISISSGDGLTSNNMNKNGNIPVYGGNGVTGFHDKYNINKKTLIIGRVGFYCGNAHISEKKAWVTDNAFITTFPEKYINFYFLELLITFLNFKKYSSSTAQPVISGKKIYPIVIPIPPLEEQERIVKKIEELRPYVEEYSEAQEKLDDLNETFPEKIKASILQTSVQGKLVPQNPDDVPAKELLAQIKKEVEQLIKDKKIKRKIKESVIFRDNGHFYEKVGKKGEPVCIDDEIPFDIPDNWEWCRLQDICSYIQRGKSPKYSEIKKYPVISQKCVQWDGFSFEKARFISPESIISYAEERLLQDKDLLWNSTGLGTLGRVAIYNNSINDYDLAVADSHVTVLRLFKSFVLPEYVYYYLANPSVQLVIESQAGGSTKQKELGLGIIKPYLIPLPPIEEQKRIVEKIEELLEVCD